MEQLNGISGNSWKTSMSETYWLCRARYELYSTFFSIFVCTDEQRTSPTAFKRQQSSILILCFCIEADTVAVDKE